MNSGVHFEMPAEDRARAKRFYETTFGWHMTQLGAEMGDYLLATTSPVDEQGMHLKKGAINGGFYQKGQAGTMPHLVIAVEDIARSMEMVKKAGGAIEGQPQEIPTVGNFVMFKDSEGDRVGMLQPVRQAQGEPNAMGK